MRQLSAEELSGRVVEWQEELLRMRCSQVIGHETGSHHIRDMRRQIARAKTLIKEMERDAASQS